MKDALLENLRGMCPYVYPEGRTCEQVRAASDFCTPCLTVLRLEKAEQAADEARTAIADLVSVLEKVDDNNAVRRGKRWKAWDGKFVESEVSRVLSEVRGRAEGTER